MAVAHHSCSPGCFIPGGLQARVRLERIWQHLGWDSIISWKSLAFQPFFTASASNIGYGWWSHDIGGHMLGRAPATVRLPQDRFTDIFSGITYAGGRTLTMYRMLDSIPVLLRAD